MLTFGSPNGQHTFGVYHLILLDKMSQLLDGTESLSSQKACRRYCDVRLNCQVLISIIHIQYKHAVQTY